MRKQKDLTGKKYGKLTVLQRLTEKEDGYYLWLCKCDCGGMIKVNTKRLNRGTITNCGCVPKNNAKKGQVAEDITGQRFGNLVAIKRAENKRGRTAWLCQCDCGNMHIATTKELKEGKCKSCGCLKSKKFRSMVDITGKRYGRLTAKYPIEKRDKKGSVYWHCQCECGKEIDVSEDGLVHGSYKSCGCFREEVVWKNIINQRHLIDGTCLEILGEKKCRSDNKSGFRGVFKTKNGKYRVEIGFKRKKYYVATTRTLEEAIQKRLEIENIIHNGFLKAYDIWKEETKDQGEDEKIPLIYDIEKRNGEFIVHTNIKGV